MRDVYRIIGRDINTFTVRKQIMEYAEKELFKQRLFSKDRHDYWRVYVNKKRKNLYVHRLVATAFIKNEDNKPEVNHIDGIKSHNYLANLEWVSSKENTKHSWEKKLSKPVMGEINGKSKLTEKEVLEIRAKYNSKNISQRELSRQYKVSQCAINNVVNSKNWAHV